MGHVILTRNPTSGKLIIITAENADEGTDGIAEFQSDGRAHDAAKKISICQAWGYHVLEIDD